MEGVVINPKFWKGRRVFLTGHTGFKGAWTAILLRTLGAEVYGFALAPEDERGLFAMADVASDVEHRIGDIREMKVVQSAILEARPEIVLHMAAQSLVRPSYVDPVGTYATNVMGTVNLLEAIRHADGIAAVVVVTSDKCYENVGSIWSYREIDRLGGHDPYSNSKGCAELVASAYRRSFFDGAGAPRIATARAGNVIGGGDWARDRLVPDAIRAFMAAMPVRIRNHKAVRPWQHVLDPVIGYLVLAERLAERDSVFAEGWNFGPSAASELPVSTIVEMLIRFWGPPASWEQDVGEHPYEAAHLKLDCTKANIFLGWVPLINIETALRMTTAWYRAFEGGADMRAVTLRQIEEILGNMLAPGPL